MGLQRAVQPTDASAASSLSHLAACSQQGSLSNHLCDSIHSSATHNHYAMHMQAPLPSCHTLVPQKNSCGHVVLMWQMVALGTDRQQQQQLTNTRLAHLQAFANCCLMSRSCMQLHHCWGTTAAAELSECSSCCKACCSLCNCCSAVESNAAAECRACRCNPLW
jgi:hypothetical protein